MRYWENKKVCPRLETSYFRNSHKWESFQLQKLPNENWCTGLNFNLNVARSFEVIKNVCLYIPCAFEWSSFFLMGRWVACTTTHVQGKSSRNDIKLNFHQKYTLIKGTDSWRLMFGHMTHFHITQKNNWGYLSKFYVHSISTIMAKIWDFFALWDSFSSAQMKRSLIIIFRRNEMYKSNYQLPKDVRLRIFCTWL